MGMFDYIECRYPLPGLPEALKGATFQTKDTDPQWMETHTIAEDGAFSIADFTGDVHFYTSNSHGSHGEVKYTRDGEDYYAVAYVATFVDGKLTKVELVESDHDAGIVAEPLSHDPDPVPARPSSDRRMGGRIFIKYGSVDPASNTGYFAEVVAESDGELVVRVLETAGYRVKGKFEVIDRRAFGRTWFDEPAEAVAFDKGRKDEYAAKLARYNARRTERGIVKESTP